MWLLFLTGCLLQQPGRTTWDTKLDLTSDPTGFLGRALHLWNPDASFGELQNQAYGYLFPQGPFFALGELAGLPDWVVQRLWSALLLVVAYEGTRYVARALGMGAGPGVLAGLAYAFSPRLLGAVGVLTGEVVPTALLPWALLPLVLAQRGRLGPRQGGLWCGVAVFCMSGVNAAEVAGVVPLLAFVVLAQIRERSGRRLAAWWLVGMAASCAWWLMPLLLLGRYSPPFLDFIETSGATTSSTGWSNSVRGSEHWLAYVNIGDQAWWPAAHQLATAPVLILTTGLVAAMGLVGLCHRAMPLRGPLLASAVLGLLCLTAASPALLGSLVDGPVRDLLDGVLAPLRNVHKVDPVVRLPLALGVAHFAAILPVLTRRFAPPWTTMAAVTAVVVLLAGGLPLVNATMRMPGYREIPEAWHDAAQYLDRQPQSRALVLPGSGFAFQNWGWTIDEPMQGVATSPWVTRSQVPLVPGATARYLDTIERRITSGEGGAGLADLLARGGITHVVLRRDLNPFVADTVPTARAEAALAAAPGLTRVATYGRTGFGKQAMIDVYAVDGTVTRVSLADADALTTVEGAPDDLLTALETHVIGRDTPVVIAARPVEGGVVGDAYRRVERQFGRTHEAVSQTKAQADPWISGRRAHDYPGVRGVRPVTSEVLDGTGDRVRVTASSSQGYAEELGPVRPEYGPQSAVDGNGATEWRSGSFETATEQWLDLRPDEPLRAGVIGVQFGSLPGARVTRVRLRAWTDQGVNATVYGVPGGGLLLAPLPAGVRRVRVEVVETAGATTYDQVRVSEVSLPGRATSRSLVLPGVLGDDDAMVMRSDPPRRACVDVGLGPQCQETQALPGEDAGRLDRSFETSAPARWNLAGTVVATPGVASAALLATTGSGLRVRAQSVLAGDPAVAGAFAFDDNPQTVWLSESNAERATLLVTWPGRRLITSVSVVGAAGDVVAPSVARLRSGGITRVVDLDWSAEVAPFIADGRLRITFLRPDKVGFSGRPMGVGEVEVDGLEPLTSGLDLSAPTGAACGLGPEVVVDGDVHATEVTGTIDDVRLGRPLTWRVCDGTVSLGEGSHRVVVAPTAQFQAVDLGWRPVDAGASAADGRSERTLTVRRWDDTDREIEVGPGAAAVLRVAENLNDGWRATLHGSRLEPVALDGWQQGYVVPAGDGGTVALTYAPDRGYRAGLFGGLFLAALLLLSAVVGQVLDRRRPVADGVPVQASAPRRWGVGARRLGQTVTGGALLLLGGPVALAGYLCGRWRSVRGYALVAGGLALTAAAVAAALADSTARGRPGALADGLAAAGVGLLVGAVVHGSQGPEQPGTSASATWGAFRRWLTAHRVLLAGLLLVLGQAVLRVKVGAGSYFWQDDFLHLDLSRRLGLSGDYLVRDYSGHVEPAQYLVIWAVGQLGQGSFLPAVVVLVGLQALASTLLLVLLQLLFGRSPWLLVPFAAYLFTPLGLATATWLAAGLQAYPLQIAMLTSLIGLVRLEQTGRRRWWAVSVAGHLLGLLFWEKAALVLPALVAVELLVLSAGLSLRERGRRIWRRRAFWLSQVLVVVGYAAAYLAVTASGTFGAPLDQGVWSTLHDVLFRTLLPGLFGGPWHADGAANTVFADVGGGQQALFVGAAGLVVLASVWRAGRAAWAGWLLVGAYLAMDLTLLLLGRGEYLVLVARDPRYVTDALPIVVIGVAAAFSARRRPAARSHALVSSKPWRQSVPAAFMVALLVGSGVLTTTLMAPRVQHTQAEDYVREVTTGLSGAPGASVFGAQVPAQVSLSVSLPSLLNAVWREQALARPGRHPRLVTTTGRLVPAGLGAADLVISGPERGCAWTLDADPRELLALPLSDPGEGERMLRIRYVTADSGILHLAVDGVEQAVRYHRGLGETYFGVTGQLGQVQAWVTRSISGGAAGMCVTEVARGAPTPLG